MEVISKTLLALVIIGCLVIVTCVLAVIWQPSMMAADVGISAAIITVFVLLCGAAVDGLK